MDTLVFSVAELHAAINQTLEFAYPLVVVQGEVSSFKVNQNKWVFFDLKDEDETTLSCFMPLFHLKSALQDGMVVRAVVSPNITRWGKFSLTVRELELAGEGSVKKAFDLLKRKFEQEGLFATERKRSLPALPKRIALITSRSAAAYNDFVTILNDRWAGLEVVQAQVQVQGLDAPAQIVRAIQYFGNQADTWDVLVLIRGGGSAEDLQAFNHEDVVRAVYGSSIPTLVAVGHEDDICLAELAADVRASTPTDAARRLTYDKGEFQQNLDYQLGALAGRLSGLVGERTSRIEAMNFSFLRLIHSAQQQVDASLSRAHLVMSQRLHHYDRLIGVYESALKSLDPQAILRRGYSIATIDGVVLKNPVQAPVGKRIMLQLHQGKITTERTDDQD